MADKILFTRETFLAAMRREKKRKQEWEQRMNAKLDELEKQIKQPRILIDMNWHNERFLCFKQASKKTAHELPLQF